MNAHDTTSLYIVELLGSSQPDIEIVFRLSITVTPVPFLFPSVVCSPPEVRHVEVLQPKRTSELRQLVETKGLGEDVVVLAIHWNIRKLNFTTEDRLVEKVVKHLNVLSLGVEDGVLR